MKPYDVVEVVAYRCGRHYQYYAVTANAKKTRIREKTRRFYGLAYQFQDPVHPCKTEAGKYFIVSGKTIRFKNHQPLRCFTVINKGDISND